DREPASAGRVGGRCRGGARRPRRLRRGCDEARREPGGGGADRCGGTSVGRARGLAERGRRRLPPVVRQPESFLRRDHERCRTPAGAAPAPIALHAVTSSASTKRAAKLAQKGKGKRVRFQGGTLFSMVVAITLILGLALIVYSRQTQPAADSSPPTINDHWHAAYGFFLCDTWYELAGDLEETNSQGQLVNTNFLRTGIHSHDDGVIHWHPYTSVAVGKRAKLKVFLDTYDVRLEDDRLVFPDNQPVANGVPAAQREWIEGETQ